VLQKVSKRKYILIKYNISRNINLTSLNIKTLIALMQGTIAKERTLFGPKL
jgi:hypothetical protein